MRIKCKIAKFGKISEQIGKMCMFYFKRIKNAKKLLQKSYKKIQDCLIWENQSRK